MADPTQAWPQDDEGARAALLAFLEGELPLDVAAQRYAACFPPVAAMHAEQIARGWQAWSERQRQAMARQIRRAMAHSSEGDE